MKKSNLLFVILLFVACQLSIINCPAQYTKLLDFSMAPGGRNPEGSLISDGTFLYGMTRFGGTHGTGVIFKIKPDGTGDTVLFNFSRFVSGSEPVSQLIYDGTFLYGMTSAGGSNNNGTIFKIKTDGTGFVKLYDFNGVNGIYPRGSLMYDGTFLYGMTTRGGSKDSGTVFKIGPNGNGYVKLLDFSGSSNGGFPGGSLISDGTFLYGTTELGGSNGKGTVFRIMPNGTGYFKLLDFNGTNGRTPTQNLIFDGTFLYGITSGGGANSKGTVFKIKPNGTGYGRLYDFNGTTGAFPSGSLFSDSTFLYGTTGSGGANGKGVIFKIMLNGTGYADLMDFTIGDPYARSVISDGTYLYGMTTDGGTSGYGNIYKIKTDGTAYADLLDFNVIPNGGTPRGTVISDGNFLYGMTPGGGLYGPGVIFRIKPDGSGDSILHNFDSNTGGNPFGDLLFDGTYLYGTTTGGGPGGVGGVFKIKPDGTSFDTLITFNGPNGYDSNGSLISDGNYLYGMAKSGGLNDLGLIYRLKPDGTSFSVLLNFDGSTNGSSPWGSLYFDGTFLYGMTSAGGANDMGVIFKINLDGTGYTTLLDFNGVNGMNPYGSLMSDGTYLYGLTSGGGTNGNGIIFKIMSDGSGFTNLHEFSGNEGFAPAGSLGSDGTYLYGMEAHGGTDGLGTIFKIKSDGSAFATLFSFNGNNGDDNTGGFPIGSLLVNGNFLYGMNEIEGAGLVGTLFKFNPYCSATIFNQAPILCAGQTLAVDNHIYSTNGTYYDTLRAVSTCDSIVITNLTIRNAVDTSISCSGSAISANTGTATYQWLDCSNAYTPIPGETNQNFTPTISGNYAVIITQSGCSDTSFCYNVTINSANENQLQQPRISVFPNPSYGKLNFSSSEKVIGIKILNSYGELIYCAEYANGIKEADISHHEPGLYLAQIKTVSGDLVFKKIMLER